MLLSFFLFSLIWQLYLFCFSFCFHWYDNCIPFVLFLSLNFYIIVLLLFVFLSLWLPIKLYYFLFVFLSLSYFLSWWTHTCQIDSISIFKLYFSTVELLCLSNFTPYLSLDKVSTKTHLSKSIQILFITVQLKHNAQL